MCGLHSIYDLTLSVVSILIPYPHTSNSKSTLEFELVLYNCGYPIYSMCCVKAEDGKDLVAFLAQDSKLRLLDVGTSQVIRTLKQSTDSDSKLIKLKGNRLVCSCSSRMMIWDLSVSTPP